LVSAGVSYECQRSSAEGALPEFNQVALDQLEAMGFPLVRCQKALLATGNSDPEAAMEWLFAHMEDPGWFFHALLSSRTVPHAKFPLVVWVG
jgi:ubiquitin carboxyl-terminal hydrolase 5/13